MFLQSIQARVQQIHELCGRRLRGAQRHASRDALPLFCAIVGARPGTPRRSGSVATMPHSRGKRLVPEHRARRAALPRSGTRVPDGAAGRGLPIASSPWRVRGGKRHAGYFRNCDKALRARPHAFSHVKGVAASVVPPAVAAQFLSRVAWPSTRPSRLPAGESCRCMVVVAGSTLPRTPRRRSGDATERTPATR